MRCSQRVAQSSGRGRSDPRCPRATRGGRIGAARRPGLAAARKLGAVSSERAPYAELGATDITRLIRERRLSCVEVAAAVNVALRKEDAEIHAFATEPGDAIIDRARELDKLPPQERRPGCPCWGCRSASRTSSTPPTSPPSTARRSTAVIARGPTRRWSRSCEPRGRAGRRQDQDQRVRLEAPERHAQPARSRAHPRRVIERIGGGGGRAHRADRHRHPDRGLDRATRVLLRRARLQANVRRDPARWGAAHLLLARHGRGVRPQRR